MSNRESPDLQPERLPPHFRWNFAALVGDASSYFAALAFVDPVVVLPIFFLRLCNSPGADSLPLVQALGPSRLAGAAFAIRTAGWFIPQFFSARQVAASSARKPAILRACWLGRLPFLVLAAYLLTAPGVEHRATDSAQSNSPPLVHGHAQPNSRPLIHLHAPARGFHLPPGYTAAATTAASGWLSGGLTHGSRPLAVVDSPDEHSAMPLLVLVLFFVCWTCFSIGEGFAGVPWTYFISSAIPARRRGRLFGSMQILGGLMASLAGIAVSRILSAPSVSFPHNFGGLFSLLFVFLMLSQASLLSLKEPPAEAPEQDAPGMREYLQQMPLLLDHLPFRRVVLVQFLASLGGLASPLYELYGHETLRASAGMPYLSLSMLGTVAGSLVFGHVNDRRGPERVIRLNMVASLLTPLSALGVALAHHAGASPALLPAYYGASFFLMGVSFSGSWAGYTAYVLEVVPPEKRAQYVGLINTMNAPAVLMPLLGPELASRCGSEAVFLTAGLGCAAACLASRKLPGQHLVQPTGAIEI